MSRSLTWDQDGLQWVPDPRHVDRLMEMVGVSSVKVPTPLVKEKIEAADVEDIPLKQERTHIYQSAAMRMNYLAQDCTDMQRVVRDLAKGMQAPTERHWEMLNKGHSVSQAHSKGGDPLPTPGVAHTS